MQWAEIPGFASIDWVNAQASADYFVSAAPTLHDPHPNQAGQERISNLFKAFYIAQ